MDELFTVPMNTIMYVLLGLLAVSMLGLLYVFLTNRIMFKMGLRNIPRRRAQTTLIVIGLMLSTLIISAAFTTGDTVDRSMTSQVYGVLGNLDEIVELSPAGDEDFEDPTLAVIREQSFPQATGAQIANALGSSDVIEYAVPAFSSLAVGINPEKRLSTPEFNIVGLDPSFAGDVTDIQTLDGRRLNVSDLAPNELYLNESAADDMDASAGSSIRVSVGNNDSTFVVKEIVKDKRFAGAGGISVRREGAVVPLATAQQLFNAPGRVTMVMVSNTGDARGGYKHADQAKDDIEAAIAPIKGSDPALANLGVTEIKKTGVDVSEIAANFLTTIFLVFGLFSIAAGILLIFLIFVMLAAERKSEMGMARAIGSRRSDIVQTFLAEGMAYNVLSAAVGCFFGVVVSVIISRIMASLFATLDIDISPHVTARSLIISYCLGVVLTFFTVFFSSWRISNINIVSAIRDIPEAPPQKTTLGQHGLLAVIASIFFRPADRNGWLRRFVAMLLLVILVGGSGLAPFNLLIAASGIIAMYVRWPRGAHPVAGVFIVIWRAVWAWVRWAGEIIGIFQWGPLFILLGLFMTAQGASMGEEAFSAFFLLTGLSLLPLGIAFVARSLGANPRLAYTAVGLFLIYIWELDNPTYKLAELVLGDLKSNSLLTRIFGEVSGDIEMFFLSGVMVTLAATFLVVYNADIILGPLTRLGKGLGALLPTLKMAIAYPLANRSRTGMTMAMFCLVIFALTVMSSLSHNFARATLSDASQGGFDIQVEEHPQSPLGDLEATLRSLNSPVVDDIEAVGTTSIATRFRAAACEHRPDNSCQQTLVAEDGFDDYAVAGEDDAFLDTVDIKLQARATGYANAGAVWDALKSEPNTAIIDINALSAQGFGQGFIEQIDGTDDTFEPITLTLMDKITGKKADVKVIGVIDQNTSALFGGIHVSDATFTSVFGQPDVHRFYVSTVSGTDNKQAAEQIESALLETGAQAESLHEILKEFTAIQIGFFRLIQGFMGLGLVVGVAAVGVIAFRTVVERRQQIGMLRAIGYTRGMVGLTFLIESAFIAVVGILSGVVFALILAWQLITQEFSTEGQSVTFSVPWLQLIVIVGLAFVFTLIMTVLPARQAAKIPIAQALRYE
ncbi:MAG: ABC transporter permease [Dehalococcoidia bacterium]